MTNFKKLINLLIRVYNYILLIRCKNGKQCLCAYCEKPCKRRDEILKPLD